MNLQLLFNVVAIVSALASSCLPAALAQTSVFEWDRGVAIGSKEQPNMRVYLWFYEWHMFGAMSPGQHTNGTWKNLVTVGDDRLTAAIESENPGLSLNVRSVADGAELKLQVTNESDREWPHLASIIACFNPGLQATRNLQFANTNSWFHSADGLKPLAIKTPREIHYNHTLRAAIDAQADKGNFSWSSKWPASEVDAIDGLIIRESTDGTWVTGIVWNRFLSAQGHNLSVFRTATVRSNPRLRNRSSRCNSCREKLVLLFLIKIPVVVFVVGFFSKVSHPRSESVRTASIKEARRAGIH